MDVNVENLDHALITSQYFQILYVEKTPDGKSIISNVVHFWCMKIMTPQPKSIIHFVVHFGSFWSRFQVNLIIILSEFESILAQFWLEFG